jgi:hypothetical protein
MSRILKRFLGTSTNDPMLPATAGLFPGLPRFPVHAFCAKNSIRFAGIALDWMLTRAYFLLALTVPCRTSTNAASWTSPIPGA